MAARRSYEAAISVTTISVTANISLVAASGCTAPGTCMRAGENLLLPPPRKEPVWREGQRKAGIAVWSADCTFLEELREERHRSLLYNALEQFASSPR